MFVFDHGHCIMSKRGRMSLASLSAASELNARLHTTGARPHCCSMPHPRRLAGLIASGDNLNWPRARSAILALRVAHGTSARQVLGAAAANCGSTGTRAGTVRQRLQS